MLYSRLTQHRIMFSRRFIPFLLRQEEKHRSPSQSSSPSFPAKESGSVSCDEQAVGKESKAQATRSVVVFDVGCEVCDLATKSTES